MAKAINGWTLEGALVLIRELQPNAMKAGYYLALAGGVLNSGASTNDLDLVAVPRTTNGTPLLLIDYLDSILEVSKDPIFKGVTNVLRYRYRDSRIDIALVSNRPHLHKEIH